jgi:hypothetical protein
MPLLDNPAALQLISYGVGFVGLMLLGFAGWSYSFRRKKKVFEPKVVSDWKRTEHIDFSARDDVMLSEQEDVEAQFVLLVQERRLVANISGTPTPDIRWRYATKAEAKEIAHMVAMHRQIQDVRADQSTEINYVVGGSGALSPPHVIAIDKFAGAGGGDSGALDRSGAGEDAPL